MSSADYLKAAVKNVEERIGKKGRKLTGKIDVPMPQNYHPELDESRELDGDDVTMYQELIGMLRWAVEIGRVDVLTELSMLSSYQASPREGHLEHIINIFSYIKKNIKLTLYFDPAPPRIDQGMFTDSTADPKEQYREAVEELPARMPVPRGNQV